MRKELMRQLLIISKYLMHAECIQSQWKNGGASTFVPGLRFNTCQTCTPNILVVTLPYYNL